MDGAPIFFGWRWGWGILTSHIPAHPASPTGVESLPIPHSTTTSPHLTPHRRGCPRRGLFRVLGHPKVFALLFPKNASYDILRAPRGIPAISRRRQGECGAFPFPNPTLQRPTLPHLTPHRRGCPRSGLFRVFDHPKVFALLFPKNAS